MGVKLSRFASDVALFFIERVNFFQDGFWYRPRYAFPSIIKPGVPGFLVQPTAICALILSGKADCLMQLPVHCQDIHHFGNGFRVEVIFPGPISYNKSLTFQTTLGQTRLNNFHLTLNLNEKVVQPLDYKDGPWEHGDEQGEYGPGTFPKAA